MEENEFIKILVQRYLNNQLTEKEFEVFIHLGKNGKLNEALASAMDAEIELMNTTSVIPKRKKLWYAVAAAASVLLIITVGLFLFRSKDQQQNISKADMVTGDFNAVLTLADGKKITLNDASYGKLAEQTGIEITKAKEGQLIYSVKDSKINTVNTIVHYNTISTPIGGRYQVNLPDGTKVWLSTASVLKFPTSFSNLETRQVELTGEAYFEVTKNKTQPFIVNTKAQEVKVLGTHFNVNSYPNEPEVKTTLLEGSVLVKNIELIGQQRILKPGEQAILTASQLIVKRVDTDVELAWKEGEFNFEDEDIYSIMRKIERWYDVEVIYKAYPKKGTFGGKISLKRPLKKVLNLLETTGKVQFKIEGRRIIVM